MPSNASWLKNTPVSDVNFKSALQQCTDEELIEAIHYVRERPTCNKTKLKILEAQARKRRLQI